MNSAMNSAEPVPSVRSLVLTYAALVALLALTYAGAQVHLGPSGSTLANNLLAFLVGLAKAVLVVVFFMEFRTATKVSKLWFAVGLVWFALMATILTDYLTSRWDYRPRTWAPVSYPRAVVGSDPNGGPPTPTIDDGQNLGRN